MENKKASELLDKYLRGECTPQEAAWVEQAIDKRAATDQRLFTENDLQETSTSLWPAVAQQTVQTRSRFTKLFAYSSAAAILAGLITVAYIFVFRPENQKIQRTAVIKLKDIEPGSKRATLTLSNGQRIDLSAATHSKLTPFTNKSIYFTSKNGEAVFTASQISSLNKIATPKGGEYMITLPDGTKVWLNAASSLRFPSTFAGSKSREVTLEGEAYFEVTRNASQPFIVETQNQNVEVLGTRFNINSYPDEWATRTYLQQGSVRIFSTRLNSTLSKVIKPGQMAVHQNKVKQDQDEQMIIREANEDVIAWTQGKMKFSNTDLPSLLKEVSRWYNLNIRFEGPIPTSRITASIYRDSNLSELLHILEGMAPNVAFDLEKRSGENLLIVNNTANQQKN